MTTQLSKARVRNIYDSLARSYGERYDGPLGAYFHAMEVECIHRMSDFSAKTVLDMGTGTGRFACSLVHEGKASRVVGIDLSREMVRQARRADPSGAVCFSAMDAEHTAFRDGAFDAVIVLGLFEYVCELGPYLKEIHRILRPGGELVFTCWNDRKWFGWRVWNDRMGGSVEHSVAGICKELAGTGLRFEAAMSTFFLPTRVFFGFYRRLPPGTAAISAYLRIVIALERLSRKISLRGGELVVKARKP